MESFCVTGESGNNFDPQITVLLVVIPTTFKTPLKVILAVILPVFINDHPGLSPTKMSTKELQMELGVVVHTCNPNTQEAKEGG
jgi:hypothetical protein